MRNALFRAAILAGVLLAPIAGGRNLSPALAQQPPTRIENAPCGWFTSLYPGAWGTEHKILINPRIIDEQFSFGRGTYRLADGTDAYEYLQRKCGKD